MNAQLAAKVRLGRVEFPKLRLDTAPQIVNVRPSGLGPGDLAEFLERLRVLIQSDVGLPEQEVHARGVGVGAEQVIEDLLGFHHATKSDVGGSEGEQSFGVPFGAQGREGPGSVLIAVELEVAKAEQLDSLAIVL